jgi:aminoglycoside phosphotransferase (APT) family kinase protein
MSLKQGTALLQQEFDGWDGPYVEQDVYGTVEPAEIMAMLERFCVRELGASIAGHHFYAVSVSSVHGVRLVDGRDVVIKVRRPAELNPDMPFTRAALTDIVRCMGRLADEGYPCPRPLAGPVEVGLGLATAEELMERGAKPDGFDPRDRERMAWELARLVAILRVQVPTLEGLTFRPLAPDRLYPTPHSPIFDFEATGAGAEWIDALAHRARALDSNEGPLVLGHYDFRVEHLRFDEGKLVAVHDWDSLMVGPETHVLAVAAHGHTADWSQQERRNVPTSEAMSGFIEDYEAARGAAFTPGERSVLLAHLVFTLCYSARCEHAGARPGERIPEDGFRALVRDDGERLLAAAQALR